jgi:hypothetical protein
LRMTFLPGRGKPGAARNQDCGADKLAGFRNVETLTNGRYLTA